MPPAQITATLVKRKDLAPDIFELTFSMQEPTEISFRPGQFISVKVPSQKTDSETVFRVYSLASSPRQKSLFQLCVKLFRGQTDDGTEFIGQGSGYLHSLKEGDTVEFFGPSGIMPFEADNLDDLILAGTGTGIAPLKSIAEYLTDQKSLRKIRLYFGVRYTNDFFYEQEFTKLGKKNPNFQFINACSRPEKGFAGVCGRLPNVIAGEYKDGIPENTTAYVCGGTASCNGIRDQLIKLGMPEEKIHVEGFGGK